MESSNVAIPSVDAIVHEFALRSTFLLFSPWNSTPDKRFKMDGRRLCRGTGGGMYDRPLSASVCRLVYVYIWSYDLASGPDVNID